MDISWDTLLFLQNSVNDYFRWVLHCADQHIDSSRLKRVTKKDTREKALSCEVCGSGFSTKYKVKRRIGTYYRK